MQQRSLATAGTATALAAVFLTAVAPVLLLDRYQQSRAQRVSAVLPVEASTLPIWPVPEDETGAKKAHFVNGLLPAIRLSNKRIAQRRERLLMLQEKVQKQSLSAAERAWLDKQGQRYRLKDNGHPGDPATPAGIAALLRHVDKVPADLALAQAALESGWGRSRFAREANNYFGQWCYKPGCGLVPARRPEGARYEVKRFASIEKSVMGYMHNLNSHPRYANLRKARMALRESGELITGSKLAGGLLGYAETGKTYVTQIQQMIRINHFDRLVEGYP